jgi:hypothetical protein
MASQNVVEALDRIGNAIATAASTVNIEYPGITNGPVEIVLAFNNDETIALKDHTTPAPYFSSGGVLTDLRGVVLPGSKVETTFPVDPAKLPQTVVWPPVQVQPFNQPPVDNENTTGHGYSKQAYFFNGGKDSLVTVGPSLPKILRLKGGGAQFWVASIGVIAQGTGKYKGARGMSVYIGSAFLEKWPAKDADQFELLAKGFKARVGTYFKIVLEKEQQ